MHDNRLDTLLSHYLTAAPDAELRERIVAAAPRQRAIGRARRWMGVAALGAALAASGAAGVATGLAVAPDDLTRVFSGHAGGATADEAASLADPADDAASG